MKVKNFLVSLILVSALILIYSSTAQPQMHSIYTPSDIKWSDAKPPFPPEMKVAVLDGDPSKEGLFTMRFKIPAGLVIPPHWHPASERVTVISGTFNLGMGEKFDESKGNFLTTGSMAIMPEKLVHFAWVTDECIIQLHGMGPWGITFINPEDKPYFKK